MTVFYVTTNSYNNFDFTKLLAHDKLLTVNNTERIVHFEQNLKKKNYYTKPRVGNGIVTIKKKIEITRLF